MKTNVPVFEELPAPSLPSIDASSDHDLSDAQRIELLRRLEDDEENPDDVVPWEQVKAEALARWKR
jgi:putative addiction module component (TIGR02574 family)